MFWKKMKQGTGVKGAWGIDSYRILDSVVKEGFSEELMSSLRSKWGERQKHCECVQGRFKKTSVVKMEWLSTQWERGQGGEQAHIHSNTRRSGMQVASAAVRQERWQYVGIAGSQFNSYASILPPLQFQVIGAIKCLFGVLLFQNLPFHLREGKHTH